MVDRRHAATFVLATTTTCLAGLAFHIEAALYALLSAAGLLAAAGASGLLGAIHRHRRWVHHLQRQTSRDCKAGTAIHVGPVQEGAVVAGLLRPRIYCDALLVEELPPPELRAVVLHERAHQRALDPLRLVLLHLPMPLMRRTRRGRALVERLRAEREILADRYAIHHGIPPTVIAAALLRMRDRSPAPPVAAFANATELRLRALLGDDIPSLPTVTGFWLLAGLIVGVLLCTSTIEPDPGILSLLRLLRG